MIVNGPFTSSSSNVELSLWLGHRIRSRCEVDSEVNANVPTLFIHMPKPIAQCDPELVL